jgi:hypothetical protein
VSYVASLSISQLRIAVVTLCALILVAALKRPGAGFEPLLLPVVGAAVMVVRYYFDRVTR